jgi:hypothetical protein
VIAGRRDTLGDQHPHTRVAIADLKLLHQGTKGSRRKQPEHARRRTPCEHLDRCRRQREPERGAVRKSGAKRGVLRTPELAASDGLGKGEGVAAEEVNAYG